MNEESYQRLVRAGLAPLVEEVPPGPDWVELEPQPTVALKSRRSPGWVIGAGAAATVLVVFGIAAFFSSDEAPSTPTTTPSATTQSTYGRASSVFVPPIQIVDGMAHLELTLLDGSRISLVYPADLDLTSRGVEAEAAGGVGGVNRTVITRYGPAEEFIAQNEANHGPGELTDTYTGPGGGRVERWDFPDGPYVVFDFSPWTAYVWDTKGEVREVAEGWANNLHGATDANGFLVLTADPPLQLVNAANDPGPDGPDIRVDGETGSLLVFINDCDRMNRLDDEAYGNEMFAFCDEPSNTLFFVSGDADVQERIHQELIVTPISSEDPELDEAPILEQATNSNVYFSTDNRLTVVDVDATSAAVYDIPELAPGDPLYRLVRRGDSLVFYGQTQVGPAVYALDPTEPTAPILIDDAAWFFIPSAVEDQVWLAILDESSPDTVRALETLREVRVDGSVIVDNVPAPNGRWPVAAVDDGLVFQGEDVLDVWNPQTRAFVDPLPGPFPVATWHNRIVTCGQCNELLLIDLDADTQRTVQLPNGMASVDGYGGAFSPDGRYVAVAGFDNADASTPETSVAVVLVDFDAGTASLVPGTSGDQNAYAQVAWSADGEWLFFNVGGLDDERLAQLLAYHPGDATSYRVPVVLEGQYYGMAAD